MSASQHADDPVGKPRVAHIITGLGVGGAERMLARLVATLKGRFESHVISLGDRGFLGDEMRRDGAVVHTLGMTPSVSGIAAVYRLVSLLRRIRPDVVHTWLYHGDLVGGLAARVAGIDSVAWNIRSSDLSAENKLTTRLIVKLSAFLSHMIPRVIVCCSESSRQIHERAGYDGDKFLVIPNGFDLNQFRPDNAARFDVRRACGIPPETPLIGLIARFDPQKDHGLFFAAARKLHSIRPTVHYLLAGTGVEPSNLKLQAQLAEVGVAHVTHLLGERHDIPRLTAALDIATCCSAWGESFPNTLGEAAACGVLCVTTDVGDAASIVGESGWVVPRRDVDALANAWDKALALSAAQREELGAQGRTRVAERYEIESVASRYASLYETLTKRSR